PERFGQAISIIRVPSHLLEAFHKLSAAGEFLLKESLFSIVADLSCQDGVVAISRYLQNNDCRGQTEADLTAGGICLKSSGLTTVTEDPNCGDLLGLHIDDWYNAPLTSRSDAPNRVCINLGCEERSFLFLPLSIARIWDAVGNIESGVKHTSVARLFMRMVS